MRAQSAASSLQSTMANSTPTKRANVPAATTATPPKTRRTGTANGRGAKSERVRLPDMPPPVATRLCVGNTVVPESEDNAFDPFDRWVARAIVGDNFSLLVEKKGARLKNLPTAIRLQAIAGEARGKRTRNVRIVDGAGQPVALDTFVPAEVDGTTIEISVRKPLRIKATTQSLKWLIGSVLADFRECVAAAPAVAAEAAQVPSCVGALFTTAELVIMESHHIKPFLNSSRKFLIAAPKSALAKGHAVTTSPLKKRFGIRAIFDDTGKVRRPRRPDTECTAAATRAGALRALSAACAYHNEIADVGGDAAAESAALACGGSAASNGGSSGGSRDFESEGSVQSPVASDGD